MGVSVPLLTGNVVEPDSPFNDSVTDSIPVGVMTSDSAKLEAESLVVVEITASDVCEERLIVPVSMDELLDGLGGFGCGNGTLDDAERDEIKLFVFSDVIIEAIVVSGTVIDSIMLDISGIEDISVDAKVEVVEPALVLILSGGPAVELVTGPFILLDENAELSDLVLGSSDTSSEVLVPEIDEILPLKPVKDIVPLVPVVGRGIAVVISEVDEIPVSLASKLLDIEGFHVLRTEVLFVLEGKTLELVTGNGADSSDTDWVLVPNTLLIGRVLFVLTVGVKLPLACSGVDVTMLNVPISVKEAVGMLLLAPLPIVWSVGVSVGT